MSAVYILWLRELKRYTRSRAQMAASLGQPTLYLLALGFGLGPTFQQAGNGSYLQFLAPGVVGMTILFVSIFSGVGLLFDRQFGFLKETLVAPGAADSDHDRTDSRRRDRRDAPGHADADRLHDRRVPAAQPCERADRISLHDADRDRLLRAGNGHRLAAGGHAGLPAGHELPGDAHLLHVGSALPAGQPPGGARAGDADRSAELRDRRPARHADRDVSLRCRDRLRRARRRLAWRSWRWARTSSRASRFEMAGPGQLSTAGARKRTRSRERSARPEGRACAVNSMHTRSVETVQKHG